MTQSYYIHYFLVFGALAWASTLPARDLVLPNLGNDSMTNGSLGDGLVTICNSRASPTSWPSCYNAWLKMFDDFPEGQTEKLRFVGRHVRTLPPGSIM